MLRRVRCSGFGSAASIRHRKHAPPFHYPCVCSSMSLLHQSTVLKAILHIVTTRITLHKTSGYRHGTPLTVSTSAQLLQKHWLRFTCNVLLKLLASNASIVVRRSLPRRLGARSPRDTYMRATLHVTTRRTPPRLATPLRVGCAYWAFVRAQHLTGVPGPLVSRHCGVQQRKNRPHKYTLKVYKFAH